VPLELHTESAFDEFCPDWLLLGGVLNEERVPTMLAPVPEDAPTVPMLRPLFSPRYGRIDPEVVGREKDLSPEVVQALSRELAVAPADGLMPVLAEVDGYVVMNFDNYYFGRPGAEEDASALDELERRLLASAEAVVVGTGDVLVLDNRRAAHGRPAFEASYGERDRWLKRVCVISDEERIHRLEAPGALGHCILC
jgi:hypothetical protein